MYVGSFSPKMLRFSFFRSCQIQNATLDSSLRLIRVTLRKLGKRTLDECLKLLNKVITVFLRSIVLCEDVKPDTIMQSISKVHSMLESWIKSSLTSPFGTSITNYWSDKFAASEIEVINYGVKAMDSDSLAMVILSIV